MYILFSIIFENLGALLAQYEEHATFDLEVMSSRPTLGVKLT